MTRGRTKVPQPQNTVERRSNLLAAALRDRVTSAYTALTEPVPAFRVPKDEATQYREYVALVNSGQLPSLRESMGGPYDDKDVDKYVSQMERLAPKYAAGLMGLPPTEDY